MRISDWSSDVCSSDLLHDVLRMVVKQWDREPRLLHPIDQQSRRRALPGFLAHVDAVDGIAEAIAHAVAGPAGGDAGRQPQRVAFHTQDEPGWDEGRAGKECVSTCSKRVSQDNSK